MTITALARPEIAALQPYVTAAQRPGTVRLNANEAPRSPLDDDGELHRYPSIRPDALQRRLAALYGVDPANVLATRGSSEAIDLLLRTFCRAYTDNIVTTPPTFSMYRVYADMQGVAMREVALDSDFRLDPLAISDGCDAFSKLVFICSPNNPTGSAMSRDDVLALARARDGKSLVVVDEAYIEFSDLPSLAAEVEAQPNLVVLRTLSKAYGLAAARCGALVASREAIELVARMLPPYAFSVPTTNCLLAALSDDAAEKARTFVAAIVAERNRLQRYLEALPAVQRVFPSVANFLLVQFADLADVRQRTEQANILIRLFDNYPTLEHCARITVGTRAENDGLLAALGANLENDK